MLDVCGGVASRQGQPAGRAAATWEVGSSLAPGAYFVRVLGSEYSSTLSFAVVR